MGTSARPPSTRALDTFLSDKAALLEKIEIEYPSRKYKLTPRKVLHRARPVHPASRGAVLYPRIPGGDMSKGFASALEISARNIRDNEAITVRRLITERIQTAEKSEDGDSMENGYLRNMKVLGLFSRGCMQ